MARFPQGRSPPSSSSQCLHSAPGGRHPEEMRWSHLTVKPNDRPEQIDGTRVRRSATESIACLTDVQIQHLSMQAWQELLQSSVAQGVAQQLYEGDPAARFMATTAAASTLKAAYHTVLLVPSYLVPGEAKATTRPCCLCGSLSKRRFNSMAAPGPRQQYSSTNRSRFRFVAKTLST